MKFLDQKTSLSSEVFMNFRRNTKIKIKADDLCSHSRCFPVSCSYAVALHCREIFLIFVCLGCWFCYEKQIKGNGVTEFRFSYSLSLHFSYSLSLFTSVQVQGENAVYIDQYSSGPAAKIP